MARLYTTCKNPRCCGTQYGGVSWRWLDSGEPKCRHCGWHFDLTVFNIRKKQAAEEKQKRASSGTGSARPEPQISDERILAILKSRFADDEDKQAQIAALIPPKEKSPQEQCKAAFQEHQTAQARHAHEAKKLQEMQSKYNRLCGEVLQYQAKIQEQREKADAAKQEMVSSESHLAELTSSNSSPFPPNTKAHVVYSKMAEELSKFLNTSLSSTMPSDQTQAILSSVTSIIEKAATPPPPPVIDLAQGDYDDPDGSNWWSHDFSNQAAFEEAAAMARESMDTSDKRYAPEDDDDESLDSSGDVRPRVTRQRQDEPISHAQVQMAEQLAAEVARTATVPEPKPDSAPSQASKGAGPSKQTRKPPKSQGGGKPRKDGRQRL